MENKESKRGQKLYYYLSRLSAKELKDFHAYLSSPLLGNSPQMARMLLVIESDVLAVGGRVIDADLFQAEFFPGQALDEGKRKYIRIRLVQMLDRLLDFVAFTEYKGDTNAQDVSLLKAMFTRGWEKYFERTYQEIEAKPAKKDFGEYHLYRMRREIVRNEFLNKKASTFLETNLEETSTRIDLNFILYSLKYGCASIVGQINHGLKVENRFSDLALEYSSDPKFADIVEIQAYAHTYRLLRAQKFDQPVPEGELDALKLILKNALITDPTEGPDLFGLAQNYCTYYISRKNKAEYVTHLRDIYQNSLQANSLSAEGMVEKKLYTQIASQMCRFGEIEWTARFVEDWKDRIFDDKDRSTYVVSKALVNLRQGNFGKVIELLSPLIGAIQDETLGYNARIYFCQALWFRTEYQWLIFQLEAFRQQTLRTLAKEKRNETLRFIEVFHKMSLAKIGNPDKVYQKLAKLKIDMEQKNETNKFFWLFKTLTAAINDMEHKTR